MPTRLLASLAAAAALTASGAEDVPYVTTPDSVTLAMLQMAKVGADDYVIDLGSGDGRIVIVAAKRFGASGLGVEIVPDLVKLSRENAKRVGVEARAEFREQDLFKTDLSKASVVTLYLLPEVNLQLRPALLALKPGTRVVSHDWDMADWTPDQTATLNVPDKAIGLEKSSKVHLWIIPARLQGAWCGIGKARGTTLQLEQKFQRFRGQIRKGTAEQSFDGRIDGAVAKSVDQQLILAAEGDRLRARQAKGPFAALRDASFTRLKGEACR